MEEKKSKSISLQKIIFKVILVMSLFLNITYLFGIFDFKIKRTKKTEFIDSPVRPPIDTTVTIPNN